MIDANPVGLRIPFHQRRARSADAAANVDNAFRRESNDIKSLKCAPPDFTHEKIALRKAGRPPIELAPHSRHARGDARRIDHGGREFGGTGTEGHEAALVLVHSICSARMTLAASRRWFPRLVAPRLRLSPPCVVCELNSAAANCQMCADCEHDFFREDVARCTVCAIRMPASTAATICGLCLRHPPQFDATFALGDYRPPVDGMVIALKAGGRLALAGVFGALLARRAGRFDIAGALIAPVPLAFERHAERGFNQALEIARQIARDLDLQLAAEALLRVRHAAPQHVLALAERKRNVHDAFTVRADVRARHVAVVDDVMTTGSTLGEIASVLKKAGAVRVTNLVVARTP